jgi:hypothetical protein
MRIPHDFVILTRLYQIVCVSSHALRVECYMFYAGEMVDEFIQNPYA